MECSWHLCRNILIGRQTKFCSVNCKNKDAVTRKRRKNKAQLVEMFGGKCEKCGYDKSVAALHFHHKDDNKSFGIAEKGRTPNFQLLIDEARKCILICANCHAEDHYSSVV
jgi:hypothetical protein